MMFVSSTHQGFKMFNHAAAELVARGLAIRSAALVALAVPTAALRAAETPNPKLQAPGKIQTPSKLWHRRLADELNGRMSFVSSHDLLLIRVAGRDELVSPFGSWLLAVLWSLWFGLWSFPPPRGRTWRFPRKQRVAYPTEPSFLARLSMTVRTSSEGSIGLDKCRSNPAFNATSRSCSLP